MAGERDQKRVYVSEAQRRWMRAHHPDWAEEWERNTPPDKVLPNRIFRVRRTKKPAPDVATSSPPS